MLLLFLLAITFICILVFIMFFILRGTVKKINSQTKLYFVDKLQEYDYLINEKLDKLNQINQEIKDKELKGEKKEKNILGKSYEFDFDIIDLFNKTRYQDKNIFELTRKIDEKFIIDYEGLLNKFVHLPVSDDVYMFCKNFRDKFTSEKIYDLKSLDLTGQSKYLKDYLTEKEYKIYLLYRKIHTNYGIEGFINYLDELVDLNDPNIFVYVGNKDENYNHLSKYIHTIYSEDIYKGIRIIYKKRIYDYSLNERNV